MTITSLRITCIVLLAGFVLAAAQPAYAQSGTPLTPAQARTARDSAFKVYQDARTLFHIVREKYQKNKKAENRAAVEKEARAMLSALSTAVAKHLETLEARIRDLHDITEPDRTAALQEVLGAEQTWQQRAAPAGSLKEQAAAMARVWPHTRLAMLHATGLAQVARLQASLSHLQEAQSKAKTLTERAQKEQRATASAEALYAAFKQSVQDATAQADAARRVFASMTDEGQADGTYASGQGLLAAAARSARTGHTQLNLLIQALQAAH